MSIDGTSAITGGPEGTGAATGVTGVGSADPATLAGVGGARPGVDALAGASGPEGTGTGTPGFEGR